MSRFRLFGRAAGAGTWPDATTDVPTDPRGFPAVPAGVWGGPPAWAGGEPAPPGGAGNGWSGGRPVGGASVDRAGAPGGVPFGGSSTGPAGTTHIAHPGGTAPPAGPGTPSTLPPPVVTMPPGRPARTDGGPQVGTAAGPPDRAGAPWPGPPAPAAAPAAVPNPAEAAALAGAFAVDYLSWDEDDPARRGRVLREYLRPPVGDPARLGWSGTGRQRGEFALPGLVRPDAEGRVLVDVRVRVTPYRAVGERTPEPAPADPEPGAGVPAVAPAPTGRGWRSLASCWVRLSVPVAHDGGRLVVDAWEETLGLDAPASGGAPPPDTAPDHALVDDDPLAGGVA